MNNIFENAKFGDKYLSIDGTQNMFCSFTTNGEDELARLYRERWGVVICYLDGTIHSGGYRDCNFNIIGKWQEPINEEELDRLAVGFTPIELIPHYDVKDGKSLIKLLRECFKAGCRKQKEIDMTT